MAFQRSQVQRTMARAAALAATAAVFGVAGCAAIPFVGHKAATPAQGSGTETAIGVNAYLWRASLDTMAFMPLASADPYGGIIITDWYSDPAEPNARFKATIYILDTRLRADGLNVSIHKQVKAANGDWQDVAPAASTEEKIENAILVRARQMRINGR